MRWEPRRGDFGILTVEDEVVTKSEESVAAFHIHCQSEPRRVDGGVVIDNGEYELFCRVLSPENAKIEFIGGEGREFEVDGVNYPTDAAENTEGGWGQIVITDVRHVKETGFLVELEIVKRG